MNKMVGGGHFDKSSTLERQRSYINGRYVGGGIAQLFQTIHPGTGQAICDVEVADQAVVDSAVEAAKQAFASWSQTPLQSAVRSCVAQARFSENAIKSSLNWKLWIQESDPKRALSM